MKKTRFIYLSVLLLGITCNVTLAQGVATGAPKLRHIIPLGGNAWVNLPDTITDNGLINWSNPKAVTSIYFRVSVIQDLQLSLRLRVPQGQSTIKVTAGDNSITKKINNTAFDTVAIGKIHITKAGYVKVDLTGISKTGAAYADVSDLIIQSEQADADLAYVKQGSSFHFGRRGPSVHLNFTIPADKKTNVKWFYNEIIVPKGLDVVGSYFMADGFGEGYFGMQVNSPTERRVLFSVWSPFNTEDPKSIPDSMRIKMLKKGEGVHSGEFGNEGSGGQSYMHFPWVAGKAYAFLLSAEPDSVKKTTVFTAYFKDVAAGKWLLVASFNRPQKATYLTHLYSFVENFEPDNGDKVRKALFTNQWIADSGNNWEEITQAIYTGDATANANFRKDYAGGTEGNKFYLQNGGFFSDYMKLKAPLTRQPVGAKPVIDISKLPVK
ncbi:DUF3472 domain-containing protein [Mucilaginibacter sp. FT3.2]|uniref:DUF3472 domain-containing protein n=1 Tax=Mucilaginibacter sp. FT3.2 TaxID=2723090 RepID=UPI0016082479|nr:DUF3472 domain-containing protein [Mucilaginibacter sp. FT3.2]MBB6231577.1 hypothetical protein [Mucilaginibacter sp. FT3.2]